MSEPRIYEPSVYNATTIYNTGANGGGGGGGSLSLFYTDGSLTENNKNKATPGGLSSRTYDSNTFYITSDNLFHVESSDVEWAGGFSPPNYITGKFEINAKLKNILSPHTGGRLLSFGGSRFIELGYLTDAGRLCVGFALVNNSWTVVYNYENPNWVRDFQGSDKFWKNLNMGENKIIAVKAICEKKADRWNFVLYVDEDKIYDVDIYTTTNFGNFVGTRFMDSSRFLEFGCIDIKQLNE